MRMDDEQRRLALRTCGVEDLATLPSEMLRAALEAQAAFVPEPSWIVTPEEIMERGDYTSSFSPESMTTTVRLTVFWGGWEFACDMHISDAEARSLPGAYMDGYVRASLAKRAAEGIKQKAREQARKVTL